MKAKAKSAKKHIVLPEGNDPRTVQAAKAIAREGLCELTVVGVDDDGKRELEGVSGIALVDPSTSSDSPGLAHELYEIRKAKGMTEEDAKALIEDPLYFGVMMVKAGMADGMVAGACHATGDVLRPALQILKTAPGSKIVSSFFVMCVPDCEYGSDGTFVFADCGLNVSPTAENLACIAKDSAKSFEALVGDTPYVAMLAHSTYGSACNDDADKMVEATRLAKLEAPDVAIDGELQLDAALVKKVAELKCPDSQVAGRANVLVFPDLDAGNIGYKLVQRLAKADAYGPITQGLRAPVNDLSRGCSSDDIVGVVALTCVQAQSM